MTTTTTTTNHTPATFWTDDTNADGERKHTIWKKNDGWTSITYEDGINEEDRFIIELAFNHLYYNSTWRMLSSFCGGKCVFVINGFHFSEDDYNRDADDYLPRITFQFEGIEDPSKYYHAYFDRKTKLIISLTQTQPLDL